MYDCFAMGRGGGETTSVAIRRREFSLENALIKRWNLPLDVNFDELQEEIFLQGPGFLKGIRDNLQDILATSSGSDRRLAVARYLEKTRAMSEDEKRNLRLTVAHLLDKKDLKNLLRQETPFLQNSKLWQKLDEETRKKFLKDDLNALALVSLIRGIETSQAKQSRDQLENFLQDSVESLKKGDFQPLLRVGIGATGPPPAGLRKKGVVSPELIALLESSSSNLKREELIDDVFQALHKRSGRKPSQAFVLSAPAFDLIFSNSLFQIGGIYDPELNVIFLQDKEDEERLKHTTTHEMMHSLQGAGLHPRDKYHKLYTGIIEGITEEASVKLQGTDYDIYRFERMAVAELLDKASLDLDGVCFRPAKETALQAAKRLFPGTTEERDALRLLHSWWRKTMQEMIAKYHAEAG